MVVRLMLMRVKLSDLNEAWKRAMARRCFVHMRPDLVILIGAKASALNLNSSHETSVYKAVSPNPTMFTNCLLYNSKTMIHAPDETLPVAPTLHDGNLACYFSVFYSGFTRYVAGVCVGPEVDRCESVCEALDGAAKFGEIIVSVMDFEASQHQSDRGRIAHVREITDSTAFVNSMAGCVTPLGEKCDNYGMAIVTNSDACPNAVRSTNGQYVFVDV